MQNHMIEGKPRHLRDSGSFLHGSLHHNAVLVKIHIAPKIPDITCQRLLIHRDADCIFRLDIHIHSLNERDALDSFITVFQGEKQGIVPKSVPHHHLHNLFIRIVDAAIHINRCHLIIIDNIKIAPGKNQKKGKKDRQQNPHPPRFSKAELFQPFLPFPQLTFLLFCLFLIPILNQPQIRIRLFFLFYGFLIAHLQTSFFHSAGNAAFQHLSTQRMPLFGILSRET